MEINRPNDANAINNVKPNNASLGKVNDAEIQKKANSVFEEANNVQQKFESLDKMVKDLSFTSVLKKAIKELSEMPKTINELVQKYADEAKSKGEKVLKEIENAKLEELSKETNELSDVPPNVMNKQ